MRWLLIAFFASLGALLLAAAGLVRHIWMQRTKIRPMPAGKTSIQRSDLPKKQT